MIILLVSDSLNYNAAFFFDFKQLPPGDTNRPVKKLACEKLACYLGVTSNFPFLDSVNRPPGENKTREKNEESESTQMLVLMMSNFFIYF